MALSFAIIYTTLVSLVYITWLFVVEPRLLNHTESQVRLLVFENGSFSQMVDGLGYTFMGVAAMAVAPVFRGGGLARWARVLSWANGPAAVLVPLAYILYLLPLGLPAGLLFPAYGIVLARYFRQGAAVDSADTAGRP